MDGVQEQGASDAADDAAPEMSGVVTFIVGGHSFQILEQTVRSRGETLLTDLLDDPQRACGSTAPVFIEGDQERFRYILDWFRYGSICVPLAMSIEEVHRECAFYKIPEDVQVRRDSGGQVLSALLQSFRGAAEECTTEIVEAGAVVAAHALFRQLLQDPKLMTRGSTKLTVSVKSDYAMESWEQAAIASALFPIGSPVAPPQSPVVGGAPPQPHQSVGGLFGGGPTAGSGLFGFPSTNAMPRPDPAAEVTNDTSTSIKASTHDKFRSALDSLAKKNGFVVEISVNNSNATVILQPQ